MEFLVTVEMGGPVGAVAGEPEFVARYDSHGYRDAQVTASSGLPDYWTGPDEAGPATAQVWVLDGLTMRWAMESYPAQPEPVVATFRLLAENPAALPPLEVGTLVYVKVEGYFPDDPATNTPVASFYGRVSDATGRPVTFNGAPHLEVEVTATSHEADWSEVYISAQPFPEEAGYARVNRLVELAGLTTDGSVGGGTEVMRALDVDHRTFMDVAEETMSQQAAVDLLPTGWEYGWQRPIIQPTLVYNSTTGLVEGPVVTMPSLNERRAAGPRVLVWVDGILTTMADDLDTPDDGLAGAATVPAAYCAMDLQWRRDKSLLPNRIDVPGDYAAYASYVTGLIEAASTLARVQNDDQVAEHGPITRTMESTLKFAFSARAMARMYLPDEAEFVGRWAAPAVTIYGAAIPTPEAAEALFRDPPLFPFHGWAGFSGSPEAGLPFGRTFHAHGLQAEHRLAGDSYVAGSIIGAGLAVNASAPRDRRVMVTVSLSPTIGRNVRTYLEANVPDFTVANAGDSWPISPRALAARFPTATPANVDPALTPYDLRLVRSKIGVL